jgi:hypothetical protein
MSAARRPDAIIRRAGSIENLAILDHHVVKRKTMVEKTPPNHHHHHDGR